ncbi:hypothetical protein BV20DRAFT_806669 [Pilatotrama ljubarskyi]|nr:hypothetical protein BV20DRAFT_806669 [Pilatotrama ljubarskyi]
MRARWRKTLVGAVRIPPSRLATESRTYMCRRRLASRSRTYTRARSPPQRSANAAADEQQKNCHSIARIRSGVGHRSYTHLRTSIRGSLSELWLPCPSTAAPDHSHLQSPGCSQAFPAAISMNHAVASRKHRPAGSAAERPPPVHMSGPPPRLLISPLPPGSLNPSALVPGRPYASFFRAFLFSHSSPLALSLLFLASVREPIAPSVALPSPAAACRSFQRFPHVQRTNRSAHDLCFSYRYLPLAKLLRLLA